MQAARGTSLSDDTDHAVPARATSSRYRWLFGAVALTAYAVDLASKQLAVRRLADGDVPVLGDWFVLHLTRNPGAAFSTGTDFTFYLSLLAIAATGVVLWFARKLGNALWAVGLVAIVGTWLDRYILVLSAQTRDFLPSAWGPYSPTVWDWALFIGSIGLFLALGFVYLRVIPIMPIYEMRELVPEMEGHVPPEGEPT